MRLPYRSAFDAPVLRRVRVTPDNREDFPQRPPRTRRPHGDAKVAAVRALIEQTTLTYSEIEKKTGVGRASICRWTSDGKWQRPVFAPRATDRVPRARASAKLKRRTLAARLDALAERYVRELEACAGVDLDKLAAALELAKMAKLAALGRRRRRKTAAGVSRDTSPPLAPAKAGAQKRQARESPADVLARLRAEGVNFDRAPEAAVKDFIDSHRPAGGRPAFAPARAQVTAQPGACADVGKGVTAVAAMGSLR